MNRRAFFTAICVATTANRVRAESPITLASGLVSASEHERSEGYAAIGQGAALMLKPDTVYAQRLAELAGKQVELIARVLN